MSERVFASAYHPCQVPCGGDCAAYFAAMAKCGGKGCTEEEEAVEAPGPEEQAPPGHAMM